MSSNPAFTRFLALARRAGVGSLDAAPPPVAGQKQMVPEIGGSSGGFIALVVTLAAILLFSCVAIFFLLRNHSPTPYERQLRRARSLRHDYSSEAPVGPIGLRDRIAQFFGRRRHAGWIRASGGEGDEWEASDDIPVHRQVEELRDGDTFTRSYTKGSRRDVAPSVSTDSVEVELSAPSGDTPPDASHISRPPSSAPSASYTDPFSSSPPPIEPQDAERSGKHRDERHFSVQSGDSHSDAPSVISMRKFDGGTKFKESL